MCFRRVAPRVVLTLLAVPALDGAPLSGARQPTTAAALVERAAAYATEYARSLSSVVADERYDQWLRTGGVAVRQPGRTPMRPEVYERRRQLVCDYVLLKVDGPNGWVPFRDVLEVDGRPVENHGERLATLFLDSPATAVARAEQITRAGTRFYLGEVTRSINMPTLALMVVSDPHRNRFEFTMGGERRIAGLRARAVDYRELYGPTLVRGAGGQDLPVSGTLWIEPDTGTVVQSVLRTNDGRLDSTVTVTYRLDKTMELWVPEKMEENYRSSGEHVEGEATYRNFRRFKAEASGGSGISSASSVDDCRLASVGSRPEVRCRSIGHQQCSLYHSSVRPRPSSNSTIGE